MIRASVGTAIPAWDASSSGAVRRGCDDVTCREMALGTSTNTMLLASIKVWPHACSLVCSIISHRLMAPTGTCALQKSDPSLTARLVGEREVTFRSTICPCSTSSIAPSLHLTRANMRPLAPSTAISCLTSTEATNDVSAFQLSDGRECHETDVTSLLVNCTAATGSSLTSMDVEA